MPHIPVMLSGAPRSYWPPRESEARSRNTPRGFRYPIPRQGIFSMRPRANGTRSGENSLGRHFLATHSRGVSTTRLVRTEGAALDEALRSTWQKEIGLQEGPPPPPLLSKGVAVKLLQFNNMWGLGTLFIRCPARGARRPCAERKCFVFFVSRTYPGLCSPAHLLAASALAIPLTGIAVLAGKKINFQRPQRPEARHSWMP